MINREIHIYFLDDNQEELDILIGEFQKLLVAIPEVVLKTYTTVEAFFDDFSTNVYVSLVDHNLGKYLGYDVVKRINDHNKRNPNEPCAIIVMSGTPDPGVPAHYMNTRTARFYADKNDDDFYERLIGFTKIAFEESSETRKEALLNQEYAQRLEKRKSFVDKFLSLSEEAHNGTD